MLDKERKYSRPQATADRLREFSEDSHRFIDKKVLLTGEDEILNAENGRTCLEASFRLLIRFCADVSVWLPNASPDLTQHLNTLIAELEPTVNMLEKEPEPADFDAILNVGARVQGDLPWTTINSNGWLARVSSGSTPLAGDVDQPNPVGSLTAASLGATEIFKRLIKLRPERGQFFDNVSFSLWDYGDKEIGPKIPKEIPLNILQVGSGAIGNGLVFLLEQLPISGSVNIIDSQNFEDGNFGTCIMMSPEDLNQPKASTVAGRLKPRIAAEGYKSTFMEAVSMIGDEIPFPDVVLNALDNIDTRHEVQRELWPDVIIDGAIGDFSCQVSRHEWGADVACLICLFRHTHREPSEVRTSRLTGLSETRVQQALELLTDGDVEAAPEEKRDWLRRYVGKQICSVIQEAIAQDISEEKQRAGFQPSVPFVACLSASMMAGELIKLSMGEKSSLEPRFQFDSLRGPRRGQTFPQERRKDCICVMRAENIERLRQMRKAE